MKIIRADEARLKTSNNIKNGITREFLKVMTQIEEAVDIGEFEICKEGSISPKTQATLEKLGYKTEVGKSNFSICYRVSWYPV